MQSKMDPNSVVKHDEKILNKLGIKRQFDVVVRGSLGGMSLVGVIECKDHKHKIDINDIDTFIQKCSDVNVHFKMFASNSGFTKSALKLCSHYNVEAISLVPNDEFESIIRINQKVYAEIFGWSDLTINMELAKPSFEIDELTLDVLMFQGYKVIDWFKHFLNTKYMDSTELGFVEKHLVFDNPIIIGHGNDEIYVSSILFTTNRIRDIRTNYVELKGEGYYDWNNKNLKLPPLGGFYSKFKRNYSTWEKIADEDYINIQQLHPAMIIHEFTILAISPETDINELQNIFENK